MKVRIPELENAVLPVSFIPHLIKKVCLNVCRLALHRPAMKIMRDRLSFLVQKIISCSDDNARAEYRSESNFREQENVRIIYERLWRNLIT